MKTLNDIVPPAKGGAEEEEVDMLEDGARWRER